MIDEVIALIGQLPGAQVRAQLELCLPMLSTALDNWGGPQGETGLLIASATPFSAMVIISDHGWRDIDRSEAAKYSKGEIAVAVGRAVEDHKATDVILGGLGLLLGKEGIAAQENDARAIIKDGGCPLTVALLAPMREERTVTVLISTLAVAPRVIH